MKKWLLLLLLVLVTGTATVHAQICERTGNVEASITPETSIANKMTFNFANSNSYQVTVNAHMVIVGEKGTTKTIHRTFVIPGKGTKSFSFSYNDLGNENLKPRDSHVRMYVERCQDE